MSVMLAPPVPSGGASMTPHITFRARNVRAALLERELLTDTLCPRGVEGRSDDDHVLDRVPDRLEEGDLLVVFSSGRNSIDDMPEFELDISLRDHAASDRLDKVARLVQNGFDRVNDDPMAAHLKRRTRSGARPRVP